MAATKSLKTSAPILPDVTLCAIVRDEMQNPAGGIKDFLATHLPLVEEAVIVDTGSVDGTRELLALVAKKHPSLRVYDREFKGFSDARNYSLSLARTKYALILDADERLFPLQAEEIAPILEVETPDVVHLDFEDVYHPDDDGCLWSTGKWYERVLRTDRQFKFTEDVYEYISSLYSATQHFSKTRIVHFLPPQEGVFKKKKYLYRPMSLEGRFVQPSHLPDFTLWKQPNPKRAMYPIMTEQLC